MAEDRTHACYLLSWAIYWLVYCVLFIIFTLYMCIAFVYLLVYMLCTYKHLLLVNKQLMNQCSRFYEKVTVSPDSLETFPGICKRNCPCLQILFEFIRAASIGWTVSRDKHSVPMTRPGVRDLPAACFPRPISHTITFTTTRSSEFK